MRCRTCGKATSDFTLGSQSSFCTARTAVVAAQAGIGARPARRLDHFDRIRRRHEDLRQQRVRIERDRREHLVELGLGEIARGLRVNGAGNQKGKQEFNGFRHGGSICQ